MRQYDHGNRKNSATGVCLLGMILSLLVVGILSATPIRHLIQVTPLVLSFMPVMMKKSWSKYAVLPLFIFWLAIMAFIWLSLLDIANIISGSFSPAEIAMTMLIGLCCGWGIIASLRTVSGVRHAVKLLVFLTLFALQVFAMWVSLLQPFARS
jgi:hypothetical protein